MTNNNKKIKICAVTRKEMTSSGKFYAIVKCGHVFHESVFQQSQQQQQQQSSSIKKNTKDNDSSDYCMTCSQVFDREQDLIWLNPPFHMIQQAIQKYTVTNDKHNKNVNKKNKKRTESSHNNNNKKRRHEYDDAVEPSLKKSKFLDILHT